MLLALLPASAQGQSPNNNGLRLADPITVVQPNLRLAKPVPVALPTLVPSTTGIARNLAPGPASTINPVISRNPTVLQTLVPNAAQILPNFAPGPAPTTKPAIGATRIAPTVATTGLGRLVAPGNEGASVVVGRLGSSSRADLPSLTVDFDGDGLINFEIAPGIVEIPTNAADSPQSGADPLGGMVGQHIALATGTADLVLDSVINVDGVVAATTFEIANGTVVLGGQATPAVTDRVVDIAVPDGRQPSDEPKDPDGRHSGGTTDKPIDEPANRDPVVVVVVTEPPVLQCRPGACGSNDGPPKPGREDQSMPDDVLNFTGFRRPPTPESAGAAEPGDLIDVSILLPLRGREPEGDQFSNYGNEEIW